VAPLSTTTRCQLKQKQVRRIGMVNWRKTRMRIEMEMKIDGRRIYPASRRRGVPNQLERRAA